MRVTKHLIDVDDQLLHEAKDELGAKTIKETVNRALDEAIRLAKRRRELLRLENMTGTDLNNPDVMRGAWR